MKSTAVICDRCQHPIENEEDRVSLIPSGGKEIFPDSPLMGWDFHCSCYAIILAGLLDMLGKKPTIDSVEEETERVC